MKRQSTDRLKVEVPDLQTQYEELLDTVWKCEERARLDDRIEARARYEELQSKRWHGAR
jgi:hypothetical protein